MTFKLNHMCSYVRNMDENIAFYTNLLGGQVTSYQIIEPSNAKYVYVQILDQLIELIEPGVHDENTVYGLKHLAFETDDLDAAYEYLCGLGYKFHIPPKAAASGNGRLAFFKDPNDVIVEVLQRDRTMYREPIESDFVCSVDHYAVRSGDLAGAYKLYVEQLGMKPLAHFVISDGIREIYYLGHGTGGLEIVQSTSYKPTDNPHSHLCFGVNSLEEAADKLRARGYDLPEDVIQNAGLKVGRTFSFKDPEGTRIELVQRPDLRELEANGFTPETVSTMRPL
ncbi:MAG: VOC family protein [Clostridia bacterium]